MGVCRLTTTVLWKVQAKGQRSYKLCYVAKYIVVGSILFRGEFFR